MTSVRVFDPAMCCSTGICGPAVDPALVRFAADLDWLGAQGAKVERFNLSQQPQAFVDDADAKHALETAGEAGLPLVKIDGVVRSSGTYPTRQELASWAGVAAPAPSLFTEQVAELVAIGAAVASNSEVGFRFHFDRAHKLGVSREDMLRAVTTAQSVKDAPARAMLVLAEKYLRREATEASASPSTGACGSSSKTSKCC